MRFVPVLLTATRSAAAQTPSVPSGGYFVKVSAPGEPARRAVVMVRQLDPGCALAIRMACAIGSVAFQIFRRACNRRSGSPRWRTPCIASYS